MESASAHLAERAQAKRLAARVLESDEKNNGSNNENESGEALEKASERAVEEELEVLFEQVYNNPDNLDNPI